MEGSVLGFFKAEWKVSDTGSAHWASSLTLAKYVVVTTLFHNALRYWLDFWYMELQWWVTFKFSFCSHWIILDKLLSLDFRILEFYNDY
jgi:hypothetical protein